MAIFSDARLLVWSSRIFNAIKFTPGEEVIVAAQFRGADGIVQCWVQGNGAGIDSERIEEIFEIRDGSKESTLWTVFPALRLSNAAMPLEI